MIVASFWIVFHVLIVISIPYSGLLLVNYILLLHTVSKDEIATETVKQTNHQIHRFISFLYHSDEQEIDYFHSFHNQLMIDVPKLGYDKLNYSIYPNGVQRKNFDFYVWFKKYPDQKVLEDWQRELRQTVRTYTLNLDVMFNTVEEGVFLKMKINLVPVDILNQIENAQLQPLYSDKGEI